MYKAPDFGSNDATENFFDNLGDKRAKNTI
jgi:hypothetical protein